METISTKTRLTNQEIEDAIAQFRSEVAIEQGLGHRVHRLAQQFSERLAVTSSQRSVTFAELESDANRLARALAARGAGAGDRVLIVEPNSIEFLEIVAAAWKLGATPIPLNHRMPEVEQREFVALAEPRVEVGPGEGRVSVAQLVSEAAGFSDAPHPDIPAKPWKAVGSGGSTGQPKLIVENTAGPLLTASQKLFGIREGGIEIIAGPLYHNGPLGWGVFQLLIGGTMVLLDRFDPEAYLATIERDRVTWSYLVPTHLYRLRELPDDVRRRYDISSLEVVLHSAGPCAPWLKEWAIDFFGADRLWEYYGASEYPGSMIRGDEWLEHRGSVGRLLPSLELEIRDDDGRRLPPGEVGEIWAQHPQGPQFSYRGSEARIRDGWISAGDLGWLDADGYLYISDRRADLILSGGANVYPAEVEAALLEHPAVRDVAVIGLHDSEWGQKVHAIVQADAGTDLRELDQHARSRLSPYKVPKSYEVVAELPRDPSGKLRRSALRAERG